MCWHCRLELQSKRDVHVNTMNVLDHRHEMLACCHVSSTDQRMATPESVTRTLIVLVFVVELNSSVHWNARHSTMAVRRQSIFVIEHCRWLPPDESHHLNRIEYCWHDSVLAVQNHYWSLSTMTMMTANNRFDRWRMLKENNNNNNKQMTRDKPIDFLLTFVYRDVTRMTSIIMMCLPASSSNWVWIGNRSTSSSFLNVSYTSVIVTFVVDDDATELVDVLCYC
jgi:hypothetical protein